MSLQITHELKINKFMSDLIFIQIIFSKHNMILHFIEV